MVARFSCMALAMGILVGCYDVPKPECGFACGPSGACPSDYTCNTAVNRCQLAGSTPTCASAFDAGMPDSKNDFIPPMLVGRLPGDNTTGVPITTSIEATFDEPLAESTVHSGSMTLRDMNGFRSGDVVYNPVTFTASFQPSFSLEPSTEYTVAVTTAITDLAGNPLPLTQTWSFTTVPDLVAPTVTFRLPAINMTGVGVGAPIFVDFSEPVTVPNGSFTLMQGATPVPATIVPMAANRFELVPTTQLAENTPYTVNLTSAIRDLAVSPNALVPVSWMFTTGDDLQAPMVVTRTPLPASSNVPVTSTVTASFDEDVISVSSTSFTLTPMGGSPVGATVGYASGTRTATLTPTLQLTASTLYTVNLTSALTDPSLNPLTPVSWSFTTGADTIGPRVALTSPLDMATGVPTSSTIAVRFDEPVQNVTITSFTVNGGAVTGTIALSAGNTIATFTPDAALPASATITVNLSTVITDAATNPVAALTFSFVTAP